MNRLLKAEWYRIRHSSGLIRWLVIVCIMVMGIPLMSDLEIFKNDLTTVLYLSQEFISMMLPCLLALFCSVVVGIFYMNKTAYYEVMAGNKISNILFSKIIVDALLVTVVQSLFFGVCWTAIGINNGKGAITQFPLRVFLFTVVIFHTCIAGVLIVTSFRQIMGAVLVYLRFAMFDMVTLFIVQILQDYIPVKMAEKIVDWFNMIKLTKILNYEYEITNHLIFTVIAGMLIEAGIWYAVSYAGMRKKIY